MLKVALTGNIASGKSTIEEILEKYNVVVLDVDKLCHKWLESNFLQERLREVFPDDDIWENNKLSRFKMRKFFFSNPKKRKLLEKIVHPLLRSDIRQFFKKHDDKEFVVISLALLYEAKFEPLFDYVVFVSADEKLRIGRLMKRNNLSLFEAKKIVDSQKKEKVKRSKANYVIKNEISLPMLEREVYMLVENLKKEAQKRNRQSDFT